MTGYITRWIDDKGYGFIKGQDGSDYFCHITKVAGGFKQLPKDTQVSFDLEPQPGKGRPAAINVLVM